eukprot:TRINITY_DN6294_c0_g1_i1.p1 TRINITY_DN6294_c0_g1~~TRINITY_DN6294_c0_g1_i1.p1  ORF type:complete len:159 (-),score=26.48 TRINITY_DN6294_c0_g1_i1:194-670(-)
METLKLSTPVIVVPERERAVGSLSEYLRANDLDGSGGNISLVDYSRGQVLGWMEGSSSPEHEQNQAAGAGAAGVPASDASRAESPNTPVVFRSRAAGMGSLLQNLDEEQSCWNNASRLRQMQIPEHACGSVFGWLSRCSSSSGETNEVSSSSSTQICA